ncbi:pur operon repressor [Fundicoccus culcitae]|uniref:Pur operon repressor n=1 Tax=Fundicoccus culcitae TaxID=2969821 RepID=A0ABY5P2K6_9LACT|nr:pur operon repressor [Fundicoccus culcitae]UUX32951.1 pur operon repressor [Fundicoccus culcitae]
MNQPTKVRRNHRLVYITQYLTERPNQLVHLSYFANYFNCAKSSISEDLDFIRGVLAENQMGTIKTVSGVTGGVIYQPQLGDKEIQQLIKTLIQQLKTGKRILPGNYIYLTDILQQPSLVDSIAKLIAAHYQDRKIDAVVTIETKGIGLASAVARFLNVDYLIVRRDSQDTEGSTISINYVSGIHRTVKKMELSKSSLKADSHVLVVDDFMRNGGTMEGLISLIHEFDSHVDSICVLVDNSPEKQIHLPEYQSIIKVEIVYNQENSKFELAVEKGTIFA